MLLLAALLGCSSQLFVDYDQVGCDSFDFDNPGEEEIVWEQDGADILISHTNQLQTCDAVFEPVLSSDGRLIEVREYWSEGSTDCETCIQPQIIISDAPSRSIEVRWYVGDDTVPMSTLQVKAE